MTQLQEITNESFSQRCLSVVKQIRTEKRQSSIV